MLLAYGHTGTLAHWITGLLDYWAGVLWPSPVQELPPPKHTVVCRPAQKLKVRYDSPRLDRRNSWELGLEKGKKEMNHCY